MRYLLLMYRDEKWWDAKPEEERIAIRQRAVDVSETLRKRGIFLAGDPLLPTGTASTVRMRGGKSVATDGPFAETKEQLLGFYIVDCASLDQAIETAKELAVANPGTGSYEIRPVAEFHDYRLPVQQKPAA